MPIDGSLAGKVGVVTGGASGIGRALAQAMAQKGMRVIIADVEADRLQRTADELGVLAVPTDVSNASQVAALAQRAVSEYGTVHLLCNNAGIGPMAPIADLTLADWQWMINVNLWGTIHGTTCFLPVLKGNGDGGHILNTASMASLMQVPSLGAYCTTKYGILGLSEVLALELREAKEKVGVTVLCPGPVATDLGSSTRNRPQELAGGLKDVLLEDSEQFSGVTVDWMPAEQAARIALDAVQRGDFYALTHPGMVEQVRARHAEIEEAFAQELNRREAAS